MYSLDSVKALDKIFVNRDLKRHRKTDTIISLKVDADRTAHIVLKNRLSKKILLSESFEVVNYFQAGLQRLYEKFPDSHHLKNFYAQTLIFQKGAEHSALKSDMHHILSAQMRMLQTWVPQLVIHFKKRSSLFEDVLGFSEKLVNLIFAKLIAELTQVSFLTSYRVMRNHQNVFYFYFHHLKQLNLSHNLRKLAQASPQKQIKNKANWLLAESLLVMGRDPLIASICAMFMDKNNPNKKVNDYYAVSEIERICIADCEIEKLKFKAGDYVSLALLPAKNETNPEDIAFGAGVHKCIGQRVSQLIADTAMEILEKHQFKKNNTIACSGAFLAFR